jgi:hypothetical protein
MLPIYAWRETGLSPGDASIALVCAADGRRLELLQAPTLDWFERIFVVPRKWCPGPTMILATITDENTQIGVGTPFHVDFRYWLAGSHFGAIAAAIVSLTLISIIVCPIISISTWSALTRSASALLYICGSGYFMYVAGYSGGSVLLLNILSFIFLSFPAISVTILWTLCKFRIDIGALNWYILGSLLVAALVLLSYLLIPLQNGPWFPNRVFDPAGWSTDNILPVTMARYLLIHGPGHPPQIGVWSITDRGVAPAGLIMAFMLLFQSAGIYLNNPGAYMLSHFSQALIQGSAVWAVLLVLREDGWAPRRLAWLAVGLIFTPFVFFNTFYVWPKLFAGALGLVSFLLVSRCVRTWRVGDLVLGIFCFGGSVLAHAASLLALPVMASVALLVFNQECRARRSGWWETLRNIPPRVPVALVLAVVTVGWVLHIQASLASGTSYGTSFLLTGVGIFGLDSSQIQAAVIEFYSKLSVQAWLNLKLSQFATLLWPSADPFTASFCQNASWLACMRAAQFFSLIPAFGILPLALAIRAVMVRWQGRSELPVGTVTSDLRLIAITSVAWSLALIGAMNNPAIVHVLPYPMVFGLLAGTLTLMPEKMDRASKALVSVQAISLSFVWFFGSWVYWVFEYGYW